MSIGGSIRGLNNASFSHIAGATGNLRVAWRDSNNQGFVADLGTVVQSLNTTGIAYRISVHGDEIAYLTVPPAGYPYSIAVDSCSF